MRYYLYTPLYIVFIVLCNTVFTYVPNIVINKLTFSVGDILVGGVYVLRDLAQREIKHYVILAMLVGGALSYLMADKSVAIASVFAFSVGETIDWLIYTITKKPLSQRLLWSSIISTPIDSFLFLYMTNLLHPLDFTLMMISKLTGVFLLWLSWRARKKISNEVCV